MLLMDKSTISMAIFTSFLYVYQRVSMIFGCCPTSNPHWPNDENSSLRMDGLDEDLATS